MTRRKINGKFRHTQKSIILTLKSEGDSVRSIAKHLGLAPSSVGKVIKNYSDRGTLSPKNAVDALGNLIQQKNGTFI